MSQRAAPPAPAWEDADASYPALRRALGRLITAPGTARVREPVTLTERLLQAIWYEGHFDSADLRLADGRPLAIRSPGRWNGEPGPDFLRAELVIGGEEVKGDVELHLAASGWRAHGHATDPAHLGVVLHVVLDIDDGLVADHLPTGRTIPRLELRPRLPGDLEALGCVVSGEDLPFESPAMIGRCQRVLSRLDADPQVTAFFEAAAVRRLRAKTERYASQLGAGDFEQVFHQALFAAMGQRASKTLFFLLAKRVPAAELRALTRPWSGRARLIAAQAVLLHVANLVRPAPPAAPLWDDETMSLVDAMNRVWAEVGGHFTDRVIPATAKWHTGVRPASFPSRRIAGLAHLCVGSHTGGEGLFAALREACLPFLPQGRDAKTLRGQIEHLVERLTVEDQGDHWAWHHTLGGKRMARPAALIGDERARSVLFNAFLPLLLLWAKRARERGLFEWTLAALRAFPALGENSVTRFMKYRVIGTPAPPKSMFRTEMRQQALFHIFTDCCDHVTTTCDHCAFFSRLPG